MTPLLALESGESYVAGAYLVFVALLLIYVAIMAGKLGRIQRGIRELADRAEKRRETAEMSGLLALGVSHRTAPLELRERLALTEGRAAGVLSGLVSRGADHRGGGDLDLQPDRALSGRRRHGRGRDRRARGARARGVDPARPSCSARSTRCAAATPPPTCSTSPPGSTR